MAGWRQKHSLTHTVMLKLEEEKLISGCSCRSDSCMMMSNNLSGLMLCLGWLFTYNLVL